MLHRYTEKWINIVSLEEQSFRNIPKQHFSNPFAHLPLLVSLSDNEISLLNSLEQKNSWNSEEFLLFRNLQRKRDGLANSFVGYQQDWLLSIQNLGIKLPENFLQFFVHQNLARFRIGNGISFFIDDIIIVDYNDKEHYLLPFLGDSQGFHWWYLLLDIKTGSHCVLYSTYSHEEINREDFPKNYIKVSSTFDEFLVRASADMIEYERPRD